MRTLRALHLMTLGIPEMGRDSQLVLAAAGEAKIRRPSDIAQYSFDCRVSTGTLACARTAQSTRYQPPWVAFDHMQKHQWPHLAYSGVVETSIAPNRRVVG